MHIYIGSDHGGFSLKEYLHTWLNGHAIISTDCGTYSSESTDYPDFALAVSKQVVAHPGSIGILVCRSGEGMEMVANKVNGIRAALVWLASVATETRRDNDANILVLPADFISQELAAAIVQQFVETPFSHEERHQRRIDKMMAIEHMPNES